MRNVIRKVLNEEIKNNEVICDGCGWSWYLSEGGDDPYICHKCGYDNTPAKSNLDSIFDNFKTKFPKEYQNKMDIM